MPESLSLALKLAIDKITDCGFELAADKALNKKKAIVVPPKNIPKRSDEIYAEAKRVEKEKTQKHLLEQTNNVTLQIAKTLSSLNKQNTTIGLVADKSNKAKKKRRSTKRKSYKRK